MVIVKTTYKFRAYPSQVHKSMLNHQMHLSKQLYNLLLEKSQEHFKDYGKAFTKFDMNKWITQLKRKSPEFKELHSQVCQNVADRVSNGYKQFFRRIKERETGKKVRAGFPRFKSFVSSLTFPQEGGFVIGKKKVRLSKIGNINFVNHRDIEGIPKTCAIKKTKTDEWYLTISTEKDDIVPFTNGKGAVGMDLGIKKYAVLSDGSVLHNTHMSVKERSKLKRLQRVISRRKKGSRKRRKAVIAFARKYEHISKIKDDRLHKLSHRLVNSYSFIAYEGLEIANMMGNHRLARSIGEESWGKFTDYLRYKAESAGCAVVSVDPRNTSKTCSDCGNIQYISLSERTFACNKCGMSKDRDLNASVNILNRATSGQGGSNASGDNARPLAREAVVKERGTIIGDSR